MEEKKGQNSFLCSARLDSSHCSGELLSLGDAADLVQKRQGHEEKRKAAAFQRSFQSRLLPLAPKCPWQAAAPSFSRLWRVCSHSHVFCFYTDYHRVNHPSSNNFLFPHPLLPPSVALYPQLYFYGPERGQGQPPKSKPNA